MQHIIEKIREVSPDIQVSVEENETSNLPGFGVTHIVAFVKGKGVASLSKYRNENPERGFWVVNYKMKVSKYKSEHQGVEAMLRAVEDIVNG